MSDDDRGFGGGWIAIAILIVGGLFLLQRERGRIIEPPAPPTVWGLEASFDLGFLLHDLKLTNKFGEGGGSSAVTLTDVDVKLTLFREDGSRREQQLFWATWEPLEVKTVTVAANSYQKAVLTGTAKGPAHSQSASRTSDGGLIPLIVDSSWTWTWNAD